MKPHICTPGADPRYINSCVKCGKVIIKPKVTSGRKWL